MKKLPRGVSNNNPGNIEWGDPWQGLKPVNKRTDKRFAEFQTPAWGIRALATTLITYQDKHKIRTVEGIINRWAPPVENDTGAYVRQVAKAVGVDPKGYIDVHESRYMRPLVEAIIRHENGKGPLNTANSWYDAATIDEGLRMAGIRQDVAEVAKVPVTRETIGASAGVTVGAAQIVDALPAVSSAMSDSEEHFTSGSIVRIVFGVITIAVAVYIAYSQVKKHQSGSL